MKVETRSLEWSNLAGVAILVAGFLLGGCDRIAQSLYLSGCDRDIKNSTRTIETARDHAQRAAGYAQRGRAYSEKARYCRTFKLIPADEYGRLFGLAVKDHDQAIALDPGSAETYYGRGQTYFDRGALEDMDHKESKPWFDAAAADFTKAFEKDGRRFMALDMLGVVHSRTGEWDKAIDDFTRELALDPAGRRNLADAYCERGFHRQRTKNCGPAIADYEKSIEIGATADGCSCEPYNPLIGLYDEVTGQYDKAWDIVRAARKSKRWLAAELIEKLKNDSGRDG